MPLSVFDIAGPIMIGPSSSHTAGAAKIGQMARALFHGTPEKVTFILHGSFAMVYKGHATDKALAAGILKMKTHDPRLKDALKIAKQKGMEIVLKTADLGAKYHPNTVKIILEKKGRKPMSIIGSSLGGGMVVINEIDGCEVPIYGQAGKYFTLIIFHDAEPGIFEGVTNYLAQKRANIADIQHQRTCELSEAISVVSLFKSKLNLREVLEMEKLPGIHFVRSLHKLAY